MGLPLACARYVHTHVSRCSILLRGKPGIESHVSELWLDKLKTGLRCLVVRGSESLGFAFFFCQSPVLLSLNLENGEMSTSRKENGAWLERAAP